MSELKLKPKVSFGKLAVHLLIPVAGGALSGYFASRNAKDVYQHLKLPSFAPPSWVFPAVWTGLYTIMGYASYRISQRAETVTHAKKAMIPYNVQLGLNFLWSFLFFKWGLRGTAFIEIALLFSFVTLTTYEFYQVDRTAGASLIPYVAWVAFAMGLNYSIWQLN